MTELLPPSEQPPKKHSLWWLYLLLLIFLGVVLFFWLRYEERYVTTNDAYIDMYSIQISPDLLLRLCTLYVDEGDTVETGQLLCQLDTSILGPQQAEASAQVKMLTEEVSLARIEADLAWDDFQRGIKGINTKIISAQEFDHLSKGYEAAKQRVVVAYAKLQLAKERLNTANAYLEKTRIFAPLKGAIAKRWVMEGDVLTQGQAIYSLFDLDSVWVTTYLQETDFSRIRLGDFVDISVDAYPDQKFSGYIFAIRAATAGQFSLIPPNNATGNYTKVEQRIPIKISIAPVSPIKRAARLYAGMSCEVKIHVNDGLARKNRVE